MPRYEIMRYTLNLDSSTPKAPLTGQESELLTCLLGCPLCHSQRTREYRIAMNMDDPGDCEGTAFCCDCGEQESIEQATARVRKQGAQNVN